MKRYVVELVRENGASPKPRQFVRYSPERGKELTMSSDTARRYTQVMAARLARDEAAAWLPRCRFAVTPVEMTLGEPGGE